MAMTSNAGHVLHNVIYTCASQPVAPAVYHFKLSFPIQL